MTDPNTPAPDQSAAMAQGAAFFGGPDPVEPPEPAPDAPVVDPAIVKMQADMDALRGQVTDLKQANMTLMMRPAEAAPAVPAAFVAPQKPEPLPDLIDNPEGFASSLTERILSAVDAKQNAATTVAAAGANSQVRYNELWEEFQVKHKDHADDQRRVRYAANIAAENIGKRGLDIERYMFTYRDQFMTDVIGVMDDIFGKPKGEAPPAPAAQPADPIDRTGGMFGGLDSGGRPAAPAEDAPDADPFADIRKWQETTGFHR